MNFNFNSDKKLTWAIRKGNIHFKSETNSFQSSLKARCTYLLAAAATAVSFLAPEGDGREPLGFFGNTVPLLMVVLKGKVCTRGLAVR